MLHEAVQHQLQLWEQESERPFWTANDVLLVGVSGGPDSLALLHLLVYGALHNPEQIVAGHLNHLLRPTATEEAAYVAARCREWGIRCKIGTVEVARLARIEGYSVEEAARYARYNFLGNLALELGIRHVVVGHTADDQAETILMHFIRGTGLNGLRGMLPAGTVPGFPELRLLRPLLAVTRAEIETYCAAHDLEPVRDLSNEDTIFFRNRLRHELLPLLEEYNPRIRERLLHTAEVVRADVAFLQRQESSAWTSVLTSAGEGWYRLDLARWRELPLSLRRRTLRQAVWRLSQSLRDVSFVPVEQARIVADSGQVGARASLPGTILLEVEYDTLLLFAVDNLPQHGQPQLSEGDLRQFAVPGAVTLENGWQLQSELIDRNQIDTFERGDDGDDARWLEYVDADRAAPLLVRTRRSGERLQPIGMHGHSVKVADLMINEKIPAQLRGGWPIVANENHLVWLVGIRLDRRVRVSEGTRRVIQLRCVRAD